MFFLKIGSSGVTKEKKDETVLGRNSYDASSKEAQGIVKLACSLKKL